MRRKIGGSVVVVTGASSGIGRATALEFARRGAKVVLAARRADPLRELAAKCEPLASGVLVEPVDVTDPGAVEELARRAARAFGRIDVWVNNAAVHLLGRFEETPLEAHRRVIETNLFGYIHGARAVLPYFREQGSGVLINNASVEGRIAQPYASAYAISKHGVRALGMSLRQELRRERGIHVCTVMPSTVDTPIFLHAGNYTGRAVRAVPPVYPAEKVARAIVRLARVPRREVVVGAMGRVMNIQHHITPGFTEWVMAMYTERTNFSRDVPAAPTPGNLFAPMAEGTGISGGWRADGAARATRGVAMAAVPAVVGWYLLKRRRGPATR